MRPAWAAQYPGPITAASHGQHGETVHVGVFPEGIALPPLPPRRSRRRGAIALGRIHAGQIVTVYVDHDTMTIDLGGDDTRTVRRSTTQPVRTF